MKRKNEDVEVQEVIEEYIPLGMTGNGINYFEQLDKAYYPPDYYDFVVYKLTDAPSYYEIGTAFARANDALRLGGYFHVDINGSVIKENEFQAIGSLFMEFVQFKSGIYTFRKEKS